MRRLTLVVALALAMGPIAGSPTFAGIAVAKSPSSTVCGEMVLVVTLPKAPGGLVATQSWTVGDDCKAHLGPIEFVDPSTLGPVPGDIQTAIGRAAETSDSGGVTPLSASTAYGVSRSWDCCGFKMNEYWMDVQWSPSTAGSNITSWSAWDGASWRTEGFGLGWHLDSANHSLGRSAGGVGQPTVTVHGHQGFSYQGVFDPTGTVFYNTYDSWLQGKPGFTYGTCNLQIVWRHSAPGWHSQQWCNPGSYP